MSLEFNVTHDPWIPFEGGELHSINSAIENAHHLGLVEASNPLEIIAIYRYLLYVSWSLKTSNGQFKELPKIEHAALYGENAWLQTKIGEKQKEVGVLLFDVATGTEKTLYGDYHENVAISHEQAPIKLLTHLMFAQGKGAGYYPAPTPRLLSMALGNSLFDTLLSNRREVEAPSQLVPVTRYIKLIPENDGVASVHYSPAPKIEALPDIMSGWDEKRKRHVAPPRSQHSAMKDFDDRILASPVLKNHDNLALVVLHPVDKGKQFGWRLEIVDIAGLKSGK